MPEQLISKAMHHTMPESYVRSDAERPRLAADFPATDLYNPDRAAAVPQFGEPESYVRSDAERPRLAADFPATDLYNPDRAAVVPQNGDACSSHSFSQVLNHGVRCKRAAMAEAQEFFGLSPKEKAKLYSDNPAKKLRLSTSFNVRKETQINLTDQLQIIKNEDLQELTVLGSGASGTVHHGKWRGTDVAIKRFRTVISSELAQEFWREAEILSKLHHPNVVAFYGVVKDGPGGTLATLIEFMVNGSLRHVLQREGKFSDLRKRLLIAMDAAFGMEYLHSKNIVHFDLKCDNLLVNLRDHSRPICKVGDFGLSKIRSNTLVSGGVRGTLRWMAPERFNESKVSEKVDVFSFGIVMWELLTGEVPYANMEDAAVVGGIVTKKLRPTVPDNCEPEWRRLMEQCWSQDPAARPAFTEIASRLQSMAAAI